MLEWRLFSVRVRMSLLFPALVTGLLLCQPEGTAVSCLLASLLHEGGHLLAMGLLGCPAESCVIGAFGARIVTNEGRLPGYKGQLAISLAGPGINLLAAGVLWALGCRRAATVHWLLGGFNLLPAAALDGGQALRAALCMRWAPDRAERWLRGLSAVVLFPLATAALWTVLAGRGNGTLLIVSVYLGALVFVGG